ncbi:MAG: protein-disulfide reductase DsbD domain-containing protein [Rhizomicrobium sp.]
MFRIILCGLFAAAMAMPAAAQIDAAPKVRARLIAEQGEIAPGGTVTIALEEDIREGWHTYWRNPGEAGVPSDIVWTLPQGWTAGPIQWPYPRRLPVGPLMNYGYEGKPWLLVNVTAPANAKPGEIVALKAAVSWLVCSPILCVPEDATLTLPLAIAASPAAPYATIEQQFAAARAALPVPSPWPVHFGLRQTLDLFVAAPGLVPREAFFFPFDEGLVKDSARQELGTAANGMELRLVPGTRAAKAHSLSGVLVLTSRDGSVRALSIDASAGSVPPAHFTDTQGLGLALAFLFALLGGLILNLMPCVLPVLAMKALAVASKAGKDPGEAVREGLAYGAGAIASFLVLGGAVIALRTGGEAVGWGFQLQEPRVVAGFALLMFAVGLNLSGVFEWTRGVNAGEALTRKGGATGAFFTGILAVAVAAPCTAPFMAAAIGFALTQGAGVALGVFAFLGVGFAAPFVALGLSPALLRMLPRPGAWMLHFKQLLAFPMYGAAAWLVWVIAQEAGPQGLAATLCALVGFAFAAWAWGATRASRARWRTVGGVAALIGAGVALAGIAFAQSDPPSASAVISETPLPAEPYSAARLDRLRSAKRPVFVDATAAWCITCLVNEKIALSSPAVTQAFDRTHTAYLVADWTKRNAAITALLAQHDRSGVPLYLYYRPGAEDAEVLPQILTQDAVLAAVEGK